LLTPELIAEINAEIVRARVHCVRFRSLHEAYAVLAEELDELWDITRQKRRDRDAEAIHRECVQIAAMAVKTLDSMENLIGGDV
jgi:penicillin-binding protein-related factor A (putative recombinase)